MFDLQEQALAVKQPIRMNSLEQSDAEEALAEWMESANIENAWKMAPTLVSIGMDAKELECVRNEFDGPLLSDALSWLEALVSSMQLVNTIEESIGRVTDLVKAVKSYAYEGKGQKQIDRHQREHPRHPGHPRPQAPRERDRPREELRPRPPRRFTASAPASTRSGPTSSTTPSTPYRSTDTIRVRTWAEKKPGNPDGFAQPTSASASPTTEPASRSKASR